MRRCKIPVLVLGTVLFLWGNLVSAAIVEIHGDPLEPPPGPWVFDYELQTLTAIRDVQRGPDYPVGPYYEPWGNAIICDGETIGDIWGNADSDSVFHLNATYKNETGIPWSAWIITWRFPFAVGGIPLEDVVHVGGSKLDHVATTWDYGIVLTGNPVLPGEAFTLNLDIYVGEGGFYDRLDMTPIVPEPASVVLFGLGGIGLIHRRKKVN